ncbi:TadE/TadG family type IV pilus assembly protein [Endozoicomonas sp.]|uniref:TadE/TadG family type IV pilus assembly protein n=1 Tax=Endozoicomonas sp. TaxID=1892382 RepID=UPI0028885A69|nr:TadE/TadG family type IV pilus assembly protein [Endozoicomonas sp.]
MNTVNRRFLRYQRGAAAIMFMLMLPVLVGFMFLSIEGGRYLRLKAQIADAAEVATLAVSAQDSVSEAEGKALAEKYLLTLVPDLEGKQSRVTVGVKRLDCSENDQCNETGLGEDSGFVEYQVTVDTTHLSWFPKSESNQFGFDPEVNFKADFASRKYQGGAVDVVLVADFSGSMNDRWRAAGNKKKLMY